MYENNGLLQHINILMPTQKSL